MGFMVVLKANMISSILDYQLSVPPKLHVVKMVCSWSVVQIPSPKIYILYFTFLHVSLQVAVIPLNFK